jgi:hypothetical protein
MQRVAPSIGRGTIGDNGQLASRVLSVEFREKGSMEETKVGDGIDEAEVWSKFSATHHYKRNAEGVMMHVSTDYFRLDPFGIEPSEKISKEDLISLLEPIQRIDDE